jgi:hypothetical protein
MNTHPTFPHFLIDLGKTAVQDIVPTPLANVSFVKIGAAKAIFCPSGGMKFYEYFVHFHPIEKFITEDNHKNLVMKVSIVKIGKVKAIIYLRA